MNLGKNKIIFMIQSKQNISYSPEKGKDRIEKFKEHNLKKCNVKKIKCKKYKEQYSNKKQNEGK